jgi:hypothetical protein
MLDALESTPFPEAQFGVAPVVPDDREVQDKSGTGPAPTNPKEKTTWAMHFRSAPWKEVLLWYSTIAGLRLQADEFPDGTFNYDDAEPRTLDEITDVLRPVLRTKGLLLKRQPNGIQLFRIKGTEHGKILGDRLPSPDDLAERRKSAQDLNDRIAELNKQRDAVPADAADRAKQLTIIKAKVIALQAEYQTGLKILEAEFAGAKSLVADAEVLSGQIAAINARSADCVPMHVLLQLQRELLIAKATVAEIAAALDLIGRIRPESTAER